MNWNHKILNIRKVFFHIEFMCFSVACGNNRFEKSHHDTCNNHWSSSKFQRSFPFGLWCIIISIEICLYKWENNNRKSVNNMQAIMIILLGNLTCPIWLSFFLVHIQSFAFNFFPTINWIQLLLLVVFLLVQKKNDTK